MNITEKYIKMANERSIQKEWKREWGDVYSCYWHKKNVIKIRPQAGGEPYIWLPRQEDLQMMVEGIQDNVHRVFRFCNFIQRSYLPITHQTPYIYFYNLADRENIEEMLWLAFVMHEKYGKQWDNEKEEWAELPVDGSQEKPQKTDGMNIEYHRGLIGGDREEKP